MSLSVLNICTQVCNQGNLPAPTTIYNNSDTNALQLLSLFYAVGRELRSSATWPQLKKSYSFATSNGVASYALPTDFYSFLAQTQFDQTVKQSMGGPRSDEDFNIILYGAGGAPSVTTYRIFGLVNGNQFQVTPTPGISNHTLGYDYLSSNWILHSATWQDIVTADTDTCAFDDELMMVGLQAKYYEKKGRAFEGYKADFEAKIDQARNRWNGTFRGSFSRYSRDQRRYVPKPGGWSF